MDEYWAMRDTLHGRPLYCKLENIETPDPDRPEYAEFTGLWCFSKFCLVHLTLNTDVVELDYEMTKDEWDILLMTYNFQGGIAMTQNNLCNWMKRTDTYGFLYGEKYD